MSRLPKFLTSLRFSAGPASALALALALSACHNQADDTQDGGATDGAVTQVQQGAQLVKLYACASCHEPTGQQGGVLSGQTTPRPGTMVYGANLTPDSATGIGDWTDAQLTSAIRTGVDDEGAELCSTMPKFSTLSESDVAAIIAYLRSQPATHSEIPESSCPPIKP